MREIFITIPSQFNFSLCPAMLSSITQRVVISRFPNNFPACKFPSHNLCPKEPKSAVCVSSYLVLTQWQSWSLGSLFHRTNSSSYNPCAKIRQVSLWRRLLSAGSQTQICTELLSLAGSLGLFWKFLRRKRVFWDPVILSRLCCLLVNFGAVLPVQKGPPCLGQLPCHRPPSRPCSVGAISR